MPTLLANNTLTLDKKVILLPYKPRPFISYEEMTLDEIHNGTGDLVFDSEAYPNYFLAAFRHVQTGKVIKFEPPFDQHLLSFVLHKYRCIGFNSIKYDIPLLWAAYKNQDLSFLKEVSNALIGGNWYQEVCKEYEIVIYPTEHIDLIEVCPNKGSLKLYGARLHTPRLQELPYDHMNILNEEEKKEVENYCINADLVSTAIIYNFNKERLELREYLGREYKENLLSKSDAQMAEAIVRREVKKRTGSFPKKPSLTEDYSFKFQVPDYLKFNSSQLNILLNELSLHTFRIDEAAKIIKPSFLNERMIEINQLSYKVGIGGLHSQEKNKSFIADKNNLIIDKDVASYYPRVISTQKLAPEGLGDLFLEVFDGLTAARLDAKARKQFAKDKGMKIAINGISGKFNSEHSVMFSPKCYLQMTLTGQLSILMIAEKLEENGISIISANTDGIACYCPINKYEELEKIIHEWERNAQFLTEEVRYKAYYTRDVNAYFAHRIDNTVKVKGPYSEVGSQTGTQLDNNPIMLICSDAIKKLLSNNVPIEKTIRECQDLTRFIIVRNVKGGAHKNGIYLGRVVRWYYGKNEMSGLNYITSNNLVATSEGGIPCMDLPTNFPIDLDHNRYITETRNILYDIDYLQRPRQLKFF